MNATNENAIRYLRDLASQEFWGTVALKFERGQVVNVKKEENLKPFELSGTPRRSYGNAS